MNFISKRNAPHIGTHFFITYILYYLETGKIELKGLKLNPTIQENELIYFENQYNLKFPVEYRYFYFIYAFINQLPCMTLFHSLPAPPILNRTSMLHAAYPVFLNLHQQNDDDIFSRIWDPS